jgi:Helix-turn-helix domain
MDGRHLSFAGAAARIETSPSTLARLLAAGDGPPSFYVGKRRMFREQDLQDWIASRVR